MPRKIIFFLCFVLLLLPATAFGQGDDPAFVDTDGDGVPDIYDACPDTAGALNNYGCEEGVIPADTDGDTLPDIADNCPQAAGEPRFAGCPDTDGDLVDDFFDNCPSEAGFLQNYGCPPTVPPDGDGDGLLDFNDRCPVEAAGADTNGCPPDIYGGDFDGDGVPDYADSCIAEAGAPINSGCPDGVTPDYDGDGVPDATDACRFYYGNNADGCILDADNDLLPDSGDACPDQPGNADNNGCPVGVASPDTDGDGYIDLYDRCPAEAGPTGLDCPDSDGDGVSDRDDNCPATPGDPMLNGCPFVEQVTLPPRIQLNTQNIGAVAELGRISRPISEVEVGANGLMAVQTFGEELLTLYGVNTNDIAPLGVLETRGNYISMSFDGSRLVEATYDVNLQLPAVTLWDTAAQIGTTLPLDEFDGVSALAISADGNRIAIGNGSEFFGPPVENPIVLVIDGTGAQIVTIPAPNNVTQLAISPDGTRLAIGSDTNITIVETDTGTTLGTIDDAPFFALYDAMAISPDGARLAVGHGERGLVRIWDLNTFAEVLAVETLNATPWDTALYLRYSADGSLLAVSVTPFVDGLPPEGYRNVAVMLDAATGDILLTLDLPFAAQSIAFTPTMDTLLVATLNSVRFYGILQ